MIFPNARSTVASRGEPRSVPLRTTRHLQVFLMAGQPLQPVPLVPVNAALRQPGIRMGKAPLYLGSKPPIRPDHGTAAR